MEIVDFSKTEYMDIPKQDNPANNRGSEGCILLVKEADTERIEILFADPDDADGVTTELAIVHQNLLANLFAEAFISNRERLEN